MKKSNKKPVLSEIEVIVLQKQIEILDKHIEHPMKPGYRRTDVLATIKRLKKALNSGIPKSKK